MNNEEIFDKDENNYFNILLQVFTIKKYKLYKLILILINKNFEQKFFMLKIPKPL